MRTTFSTKWLLSAEVFSVDLRSEKGTKEASTFFAQPKISCSTFSISPDDLYDVAFRFFNQVNYPIACRPTSSTGDQPWLSRRPVHQPRRADGNPRTHKVATPGGTVRPLEYHCRLYTSMRLTKYLSNTLSTQIPGSDRIEGEIV